MQILPSKGGKTKVCLKLLSLICIQNVWVTLCTDGAPCSHRDAVCAVLHSKLNLNRRIRLFFLPPSCPMLEPNDNVLLFLNNQFTEYEIHIIKSGCILDNIAVY
ncbi:hypothetical protein GDO86_013504 [Hymenochirus boettgeri]|uniref:Secreted protein n=1 Tax=Hymenochirus boettgeri TaxID=247094 RepID=A0A8T2IRL0_9PIPI|nr:hypothetical protein GDO86_013504 [Hymenochirus boettgeri]